MLINFSAMNTINQSPNLTTMHDQSLKKNISLGGSPTPKQNMISSTYKRKLSLKKGHTRNNTDTTLMDKIIKVNILNNYLSHPKTIINRKTSQK
jgi:hypothetical protein